MIQIAIISIDIPDAALSRVRDAFCAEFNYQSTLDDGTPNPQTKGQFVKAQIINYVKQVTKNYEANAAAQTARQQKETEVNSINIT